MPDLATVTLEGVEILSTGGPVHGVGSPPEGDYWTTDQLRSMAEAAHELEAGGEWRVPAKIGEEPLGRSKLGHDPKQALLSTGELPAAGWLTNQRLSDDGTRLLADIVDIPQKIAPLIKAKAYRTRSAELGSITSQKTGKRYDWVVTGLGWLGGKMPAVRTLDDIVALYEGDEENERKFVQYTDVEPDPEALRDAVAHLGTTLLEEAATEIRRLAESRPTMPEITLTDEQVAELRDKLGVDGEEVTVEKLLEAATEQNAMVATLETKATELEAKVGELDQRKNEAGELEKKVRKLEDDVAAEQKRRLEMECDTDLTAALNDGRIVPADLDDWRKDYEENQEGTRRVLARLKPDPEIGREFGSDAHGDDENDVIAKQYEAEMARNAGVKAEELI